MRLLLIEREGHDTELGRALETGLDAADIATARNRDALEWNLSQPAVDATVVNANLDWMPAAEAVSLIHETWGATPVLVIGGAGTDKELMASGARLVVDFSLDGFAELLRSVRESVKVKTEERYRRLFVSMPAALYLSNAEGRLLDANPALVDLLGYPDFETLAKTDIQEIYVNPDDREHWKSDVVEQGTVLGFETRLYRYDGSEVWVRENSRAISQSERRSDIFYGSLEDIGAQKSAEKAVRDSESWYRTLFDAANDAIFLMDGERIIDCNARTLAVFGGTHEQIIGLSPGDLSPPEQASGQLTSTLVEEYVGAALRGESVSFEWCHQRLDGEGFDAEVSLSRVDVGARSFLQGIVRDVTEKKKAEETLRRREAILEAVGFAAAKFLQAPEWQVITDEVLAHFGQAAAASRLFLLEAEAATGDTLATESQFSWSADGEPAPDGHGFPESWLHAAMVGQLKQGLVSELDEAQQRDLRARGVQALAVVPVFAGGEAWGFLGVEETEHERVWSAGELEALRAAAQILGGAIFLGQAREAVRIRNEQLEILNRVSGLLASTLDATSVMQEIAEIVRERCQIDHVSMALVEDGALRFVAWSGYDAPHRESGLTLDGPGLIPRAAVSARQIYIPDVSTEDGYLSGDERVRSEFVAPILLGDEVIGVLNCESFDVDGITRWQQDVIKKLAAQAAIAIRNANTFRQLEGQ